MMQIQNIKVSDITPYSRNPRQNKTAVSAVAESIKQFGFKVPLVLDPQKVVITGHTRLEAAKKLGLTEVPCIIADDLPPEKIRAYRLADNKVAEIADWDPDLLRDELEALQAEELDLNFSDLGFEDPEKTSAPTADQFGDSFTLPDGGRPDICTYRFTLHYRQKELLEYALALVKKGEVQKEFSNDNADGNALYTMVKEWVELKKSK